MIYAPHPALKPVDRKLPARKLSRLLPWYARLLGVGDWQITLALMPERNLQGSGRVAEVGWNLALRTADISLRDDFDEDEECDMELAMVHELVHLVLAASNGLVEAETGSLTHAVAVEQPVEAVARAVVGLARTAPGYPL